MVDTHPAATEQLMRYWAEGEGAAKIRWNTPHDFDRCVVELGKYVRPDEVHGLCANLHHRATGAWPGHAPGDKGIEGDEMIYTKAVGLVDTVETDDPNGAFEVILSAATLDRDGEVIDSRAFDPLPEHVPFDIDHGMTVQTTVGSGTPFYAEDGSLRVKGTFASTPLAQEVRTLVSEGHIRTTSVTFMAATRSEDAKGVKHVTTAELLNGTFTPVPSNRESVVLSAKSVAAMTEEKVGARNNKSDAEKIQAMHDTAASLGASCGGKSHTHAEEKAAEVEPDEPADTLTTSDTEQSADDAATPAAEAAVETAPPTDEGSEKSVRAALLEQDINALFLGGQ